MPANEWPALSSPSPDERTAKRLSGGIAASHGSRGSAPTASSPASLGTTIPSGTGSPACLRRPQLNALPPTRSRSAAVSSSSVLNVSTNVIILASPSYSCFLEADDGQADDADGVDRQPGDRRREVAHGGDAQDDPAQDLNRVVGRHQLREPLENRRHAADREYVPREEHERQREHHRQAAGLHLGLGNRRNQ